MTLLFMPPLKQRVGTTDDFYFVLEIDKMNAQQAASEGHYSKTGTRRDESRMERRTREEASVYVSLFN